MSLNFVYACCTKIYHILHSPMSDTTYISLGLFFRDLWSSFPSSSNLGYKSIDELQFDNPIKEIQTDSSIDSYDHIHTIKIAWQRENIDIGRTCFPLPRSCNNYMLDIKSHECLFFGYSPSHKCYMCISSSGIMYLLKDVLFNESRFPFLDVFTSLSN